MKAELNLSSVIRGAGAFISRFRTIIFFLIVSGGLFAAILSLLTIIELSSTKATSTTQTINGTFDDETIRRLNEDAMPAAPPTGRQNPFTE